MSGKAEKQKEKDKQIEQARMGKAKTTLKNDYESILRDMEQEWPDVVATGIIYRMISFDDLKRTSVVEVTQKDGVNGLSDPAMGSTDDRVRCSTCGQHVCGGHHGHIVLAEPIALKLFMRDVIRILNLQCSSCGGLILSDSDIKESGILQYSGRTRWELLEQKSLGKLCHRALKKETQCVRNPNYASKASEEQGVILYYLDNPKDLKRRAAREVIKQFEKFTEKDLRTIGKIDGHNPKDMVAQGIPVLPPRLRPVSIIGDNVYPHPLTEFYAKIIKHNQELKALQSKPKADRTGYDLHLEELIREVNHFIDNSEKESKQHNRPMDGIKQKLGGKEGWIRRNIQGKRVDYAGRSVLTPYPDLKFGQLAIPRRWRDVLTPSERVSRYNIDSLTALLRKGEIVSITKNGKKIRMDESKRNKYSLEIGDMVDRFLRDGDYVAWNRQPTLHKESFMGYEVVLWDEEVIGVHLSYTTPTNADFDGDEGNVHVPRSYETQAELREIMNVKRCILSTEDNGTTLGIVYDVILGLTLLTLYNPIISKSQYNDYLLKLTNTSALPTLESRLARYGVASRSGRALFSAMLPVDFYYRNGDVLIRDGVLINGYIKKSYVGTARNSIIQVLAKKYGEDRTSDFLTDTSFVINAWLTEFGFSVGYSDLTIKEEGVNVCEKESLKQYAEAKLLIESMNMKFDNPLEQEKAEREIVEKLNEVRNLGVKRVTATLPLGNRLGLMVEAGSKGSTQNIAQIVTSVGQQTIKGQRPKPSIRRGAGEQASMVCTTYDLEPDPDSRGFCANSFKRGLTPREYFIHLLTGREGLLDTATNIQKVGWLNHRNTRSLEDLKVAQDGSVRNSKGRIVQIFFGEDSLSASQLQIVKGPNGEDVGSFIDIESTINSINSLFGFE